MSVEATRRALDDLASRYWAFLCEETPVTAILAGERTSDDVLFRESLRDYERRGARAAGFLSELERTPEHGLGAQELATHRLLRHELETLLALRAADAHLRPSLHPNGPSMKILAYVNATEVESAHDAARFVARLASIPAYLRDLETRLREGAARGYGYPRVVLRVVADAARAAFAGSPDASPWMGPFARARSTRRALWGDAPSKARALIVDEIAPAFDAFAAFVDGELAASARQSVSCAEDQNGRALYRAVVRDFTTTEAPPEEIHQTGQREIERLRAEIDAVASEAGFANDVAGYRRHLGSSDFFAPSKEALRETIEILSKRIDAKIPLLFGRIPRMTYGVTSMPESIAERMPPAYAQPNPADRSSAGVHWITSLPSRLPLYMKVPLALHEAWPGHLMHVALLQESEHLPAFRRHGALRYSVCLEGWALYCEGLGIDMGLYETPHDHYGRLESELWRAVRLVVDTGLHWFGWDRQEAIDFMAAHLALPRATIEGEVDRYIAWPGQALSYQLGKIAFCSLRSRAEARLGDAFSLRGFHDTLMDAGPSSLPVLEALVDAWIASSIKRRETTGPGDARSDTGVR